MVLLTNLPLLMLNHNLILVSFANNLLLNGLIQPNELKPVASLTRMGMTNLLGVSLQGKPVLAESPGGFPWVGLWELGAVPAGAWRWEGVRLWGHPGEDKSGINGARERPLASQGTQIAFFPL